MSWNIGSFISFYHHLSLNNLQPCKNLSGFFWFHPQPWCPSWLYVTWLILMYIIHTYYILHSFAKYTIDQYWLTWLLFHRLELKNQYIENYVLKPSTSTVKLGGNSWNQYNSTISVKVYFNSLNEIFFSLRPPDWETHRPSGSQERLVPFVRNLRQRAC